MKSPLSISVNDVRAQDFLSVVRAIECMDHSKPRLGLSTNIEQDPLRLSQHVSLAFQGTELHALDDSRGNHKHSHRLYCNFLGLLGTNGPLPLHYTEYAIERDRISRDPTFKEFIDLFNHRLLSLFYRSLSQHDPAINFDRPGQDAFTDVVSAIGGYFFPDAQDRDRMPDHVKRWHGLMMGSRCKSPDGLKAVVGHYFDVPVEVQEFVGEWLALPDEVLLALGSRSASAELGKTTILGRRVWSTAHKFRLRVGPLSREDYCSFRPGEDRALTLHDFVRNYVGDELEWDIEFVVDENEIGALYLNQGRALGFDSWLTGPEGRTLTAQSVVVGRQFIGQTGNRRTAY